jgi:hypothetical protein
MKLRVVSPRETIIKYLMIEIFAILFFLLILRNLTPYRYFSVMQVLQYALLGIVALFILLPVWVELFGFGSARFLLSSRGVIYQTRRTKYKLSWSEIERVILMPDLYGQVTRRSYLVFYADEKPNQISGRSEFHPRAFGLQYRKGLPEAIAQYCDLEIENLDAIVKASR